jgi:type III pantothenate kinase
MSEERRILAVDCGNTQIKLGVFRDGELAASYRLATDPQKTSDEYAILLRALLTDEGLAPRKFDGAILASVVPPVQPLLERAVSKVLGRPCLEVTPALDTGIRARVDNPAEVGADLVCLAAGAAGRYRLPAVVCSFGTATAILAVVSPKEGEGGGLTAELAGVAIAPGILSAVHSLFADAAKLPQIDLVTPRTALGQNTIEAMRAGVVFGFAGLAERVVGEMIRELALRDGGDTAGAGEPPTAGTVHAGEPTIIATGGLLNLISHVTRLFQHYDPFLSLHGLRLIWERNAG